MMVCLKLTLYKIPVFVYELGSVILLGITVSTDDKSILIINYKYSVLLGNVIVSCDLFTELVKYL